MTCINCGATLSCGCQQRTASNGGSACTNCIASYENKIALLNQITNAPPPPPNPTP
jgi:hypothetical protein